MRATIVIHLCPRERRYRPSSTRSCDEPVHAVTGETYTDEHVPRGLRNREIVSATGPRPFGAS